MFYYDYSTQYLQSSLQPYGFASWLKKVPVLIKNDPTEEKIQTYQLYFLDMQLFAKCIFVNEILLFFIVFLGEGKRCRRK